MNCKDSTAQDRSAGILLIDKPEGPTSHDIVHAIRKKSGIKKVGHAGTLDPMARGLLIILLGAYTKQSQHFSNYEKEYEACIFLGITTDTADKEGRIIKEHDAKLAMPEERMLEDVFKQFTGETLQVPPMYSAKKINGKKLYNLARKGITVKREPRRIFIEKIEINDISLPRVAFSVKCSKGTYIRQLAHDIGERLGCGAHLSQLKRTKIGPFSLADALAFEEVVLKSENIYENTLRP